MTVSLPVRLHCQSCDLHQEASSVGTPGLRLLSADSDTALIFVGRNPGAQEDEQGLPFIGRSGVLLRGVEKDGTLSKPGAYVDGESFRDLCSVYVLNMVRCFRLNNDAPTAAQAKACSSHFLDDLEAIAKQHSRIVCVFLGGDCVQYLYRDILHEKPPPLRTALKLLAEPHTLPNNVTIHSFFTYHPAYILRQMNKIFVVQDTLRLVKKWLTDTLPASTTTLRIIDPCSPSNHPDL